MCESCNELAFVTADRRPSSKHVAGFGQIVDVPAYRFAVAHVARDPRLQPARTLC
jgi:hypothetical protein